MGAGARERESQSVRCPFATPAHLASLVADLAGDPGFRAQQGGFGAQDRDLGPVSGNPGLQPRHFPLLHLSFSICDTRVAFPVPTPPGGVEHQGGEGLLAHPGWSCGSVTHADIDLGLSHLGPSLPLRHGFSESGQKAAPLARRGCGSVRGSGPWSRGGPRGLPAGSVLLLADPATSGRGFRGGPRCSCAGRRVPGPSPHPIELFPRKEKGCLRRRRSVF